MQLHLQEHRRDRQEHPDRTLQRHGQPGLSARPEGVRLQRRELPKGVQDYKYFALQHNGWCSCENDLQHATKYGTSSCGFYGGGWCNYIFRNDDLKAPTAGSGRRGSLPNGHQQLRPDRPGLPEERGLHGHGGTDLGASEVQGKAPRERLVDALQDGPIGPGDPGMPAKNVTEAECRQFANTRSLFKGCYKDCSGRDLPSHQGNLTLEQCRAKRSNTTKNTLDFSTTTV